MDTYEIGYLCGGAERVALLAIVALHQDGRIAVAAARHRVGVRRRTANDAVEQTALDTIPEAGRLLGQVLFDTAWSPAVGEVRAALVRQRLYRRGWPAGRTLRGRRLARLLMTKTPSVATHGVTAVADDRLRTVVSTPDPVSPIQAVRRRRPDGVPTSDDPGGDYSGAYLHWHDGGP